MDIEKLIVIKKNGLVTFTIRINAGNIVDLQSQEYVDTRKKYPGTKQNTGEKFTVTRTPGEGSTGDAVRDDKPDTEGSWWSGGRFAS